MQSSTRISTKALAEAAMLSALALIFSYIEFLIPINIGFPGVKLGLANVVIVIAIYRLGWVNAFVINLVRILLAALLFGNMFSAIYSLAGGILSIAIMLLFKKTKLFSVIGVSMAGGVFHNLGQIIACAILMQNVKAFLYFPVLLLFGVAAGVINGVISILILRKLK